MRDIGTGVYVPSIPETVDLPCTGNVDRTIAKIVSQKIDDAAPCVVSRGPQRESGRGPAAALFVRRVLRLFFADRVRIFQSGRVVHG